jgi:hypothetical protein
MSNAGQINRAVSPMKLRYDPIEGWALIIYLILLNVFVDIIREFLGALISFLIVVVGVLFSKYHITPIYRRARRLLLKDATTVLRKDSRPPIIYLRPFANDGLAVPEAKNAPSYEELLEGSLPDVGPFLAIGNPADELAQPGAARMYVPDDGWREVVLEFTNKAQLILASIGESPGFLWEIQQVSLNVSPERIILCLPIYKAIQEKEQSYKRFREATAKIFPHPLPEEVGTAQFLYFDRDWIPHLLTPQREDQVLKCSGLGGAAAERQIEVLRSFNLRFIPDKRFYSSSYQALVLLRYTIITTVGLLLFFGLTGIIALLIGNIHYK